MVHLRNRRGISLMEVLFAVGVIAVGLLGVISIMPVALDQIGRGHTSERVARLGQNAEEEFFSRDMFLPTQWRQPQVRPATVQQEMHWAKLVPFVPGALYCLDPQFVAANVDQGVAGPNPPPAAPPNHSYSLHPDYFPYAQDIAALSTPGTAYPLVNRISLRTPPWPYLPARAVLGDILRQPLAELFFSLEDELAFEQPAEKTLPPSQVFGAGAKRQAEGNYSWFATLAPVTTMTAASFDSYYLSIVVLNRRNAAFSMTNHDEALAYIPEANFHADGYRGGDVTLVAPLPEELDVQAGQWVMLLRNWQPFPPSGPWFQWGRWYRVLGADRMPVQNGTLWNLDVTLEGPDWPVNKLASPLQPTTRVAIVRGVTEVFERTMRLE